MIETTIQIMALIEEKMNFAFFSYKTSLVLQSSIQEEN